MMPLLIKNYDMFNSTAFNLFPKKGSQNSKTLFSKYQRDHFLGLAFKYIKLNKKRKK